MLGSWITMHWTWKNCPKAWHRQYCGKDKDATIFIKAVASHDLCIRHCFLVLPGTVNDINVLQRPHLFARLASGDVPTCNYEVNGRAYTKGYYLSDGIYPCWSTFVKTTPNPINPKQARFAKEQEACRKDIERAFGVLQARYAIVRGPGHLWDKKTPREVMTCCVILLNMIIEDERDLNLEIFYDNVGSRVKPTRNLDRIQAFLETYREVEDANTHDDLQHNLIEHHGQLAGRAPTA